MAKIVFRQKAIDDLNNTWNYTYKKWSEKQADKYYAILRMACNGIEKILKSEKIRGNKRQLT